MSQRSKDCGVEAGVAEMVRKQTKPARHAITGALIFLLACAVLYFWRRHGSIVLKTGSSRQHGYKLNPSQHSLRPAATLRYHWRITSDEQRPDGVAKHVFLINNAFPGPTIEARSGDRIIVEVENGLIDSNRSVAIHWHGLRMQGANDMDGAAGITQDAVPPGNNFTYDFEIADDQSGTFWYHAHSAVQRADGLFGGLVVHEPKKSWKRLPDEYLLMIGDWYHRHGDELLEWYMSASSFGMEPLPDSILVNGRGTFNCDDAVPARPLDCQKTSMAPLLGSQFKTETPMKLRIVNTGIYSGFTFGLPGSPANVVAVDGGNAVDKTASADTFGVLHPGERVDVVVLKSGALTSLSVMLDKTPYKYQNPALTRTQEFVLRSSASTSKHIEPSTTLSLSNLTRTTRSALAAPDQQVVLYAVSEKLAHLDYVPHGTINRTYWQSQTPALSKLDRDSWNDHQFVPHIDYDAANPQWIDLVVNNLDEEDHPFHAHGYDFYVMSTYSSTYNWGSYNPYKDAEPPGGSYSTAPLMKDTVAIPRRGYAVLRFKVDNPGLWMFHCHVLWHLASGMAMTLDVS